MEHDVPGMEPPMLILDATALVAIASVLTALSTLIWSIRRRP